MVNKKFMIILCVLIVLLSLGASFASDVSNQNDVNETVLSDSSNTILAADDSVGTFDDFCNDVKDKSEVTLTRDYKYSMDDMNSYIFLYSSLTINGNGHTINGINEDGDRIGSTYAVFYLWAQGKVTLNNINFVNCAQLFEGTYGECELNGVTISNAAECSYVINTDSITVTDSNFYNNVVGKGIFYAAEMTDVSKSIFIGNSGTTASIASIGMGANFRNCIFIDNGNNMFDDSPSASNNYWAGSGTPIGSQCNLVLTGPDSIIVGDSGEYTIKFDGDLPALEIPVSLDPNLGTVSPATLSITNNPTTFTVTPASAGNTYIKIGPQYNLLSKSVEFKQSTKSLYSLTVNVANTLYTDPIVVNVNLRDKDGIGVAGTVVATIDGNDYNINTDSNGVGTITIDDDLSVGTYRVDVKYTSLDEAYRDTTNRTDFTIGIGQYNLDITTNNVDYRQPITVDVSLKDEDNEGITGTVVITLNGISHDVEVTDGIGSITFNDKTLPGQYTINAEYTSTTATYEDATASTDIIINDIPLKDYEVTIDAPDSVLPGTQLDAIINLRDADGNPVVTYVNVSFGNEKKLVFVDGDTLVQFNANNVGKFYLTVSYITPDLDYRDALLSKLISVKTNQGNFAELEQLIKDTVSSGSSTISLEKNYKLDTAEQGKYVNGIEVNGITIEGNGYTIDCANDANEKVRLFYLTGNAGLTLKNLNILNANAAASSSSIAGKNGDLIYMANGGSVSLNGVNVTNCGVGNGDSAGIVYSGTMMGSSLAISNSNFISNIAIANLAFGSVSASDSTFVNNTGMIFNAPMAGVTISKSVFINNTGSQYSIAVVGDEGTVSNSIFINNRNPLFRTDYQITGSGNYFGPNQKTVSSDISFSNDASLTISGDSTFSEDDAKEFTIQFSNANLPVVDLGVSLADSNLGTLSPVVLPVSGNEATVTLTPKTYGNTKIIVGEVYGELASKDIEITQSLFKSYKLTVSADDVVYGENIKVTVTLHDEDDAAVSGTVNIAIGDISKDVVVDGEGSIEFPATVVPNGYTLTATYTSQDPAYKNAVATAEVTVSKAQNPVSLTISANEIKEGKEVTLTATLEKSSENQVIAFYNGATLLGTNKTNEDGVAVLNIKPTYGSYEIYAEARENNYYLSSVSDSVDLNVEPLTFTNLVLKSSADLIMEPTTVSFNVTLTDSEGNPFVDTNVLIFINNVNEFNLTTDDYGKASFNVQVDNPGVVYVIAKYLGDEDSYANQSALCPIIYSEGNNFADLDLIIQSTPENFVITLVKDYIFDLAKDSEYLNGITIDKDLIIDGNGHTISGANMSALFNIDGANVVFQNVNLVDAFVSGKSALTVNDGELTLMNSNVTNIINAVPAGAVGDVFTKEDVLLMASYIEAYYHSNNVLPNDVIFNGKSYPLPWISYVLGRAAINYYQDNFDDIDVKEVNDISSHSGAFDSSISYTPAAYIKNSQNIERGGFTSRFVDWIPKNSNTVPRFMGASPYNLYYTSFVEGIARALVLYGENGEFQDISFIGNIEVGSSNSKASVLSATGSKVNFVDSIIDDVPVSDLVAIDAYNSDVTANNLTLSNINAKTGLYVRLGSLDINNSNFVNITGLGENMGGAITTQGIEVNINNTEFSKNTANEVNSAGGCLKISAGKVTVENSLFEDSSAYIAGAIFAESGSVLALNNVTVRNNTGIGSAIANSFEGSAITVLGESQLAMTNSTVIGNKEFTNIYGSEGSEGIYVSIVMVYEGDLKINNCEFVNNSAPHSSVVSGYRGTFDCSDSLFVNNTGGMHGVLRIVSLDSGTSKIFNSTFIGNNARVGGAINGYNHIVANSTFINNTASICGGAIDMNEVVIYNSTFIGNYAPKGGAIGAYFGGYGKAKYCIFIDNDDDSGKVVDLDKIDKDLSHLDFNFNYWGTNDNIQGLINIQFEDDAGTIIGQYQISNYITLDISGDSETYQTLPTDYTIKFAGQDADKLPLLDVTVADNHENATMTPDSLVISDEDSISQLYAKNYSDLTISVKYGDITLATYDVTVKELIRKNYTFKIEANNVTYGADSAINFTLFDEDGNGLDATIIYYVGESEYEIELVGGKASESIEWGAGNYTIKSNYTSKDFFYNNASAVCYLSIAKATVNITLTVKDNIYGEKLILNATVDKDLEGEDIYFTLKDHPILEYYDIFIENNSAVIGVTGLNPGSYYLNVTFEGNDNYLPAKANLTFEIYKIATKLSVNVSDVTYGQPIALNANLTGITNASVVKVIINGTEYTVNVDKNGIGQLAIPDKLDAGNYNFTAQFAGDDYHNAAAYNGSFKVNAASATLAVTIKDKMASQDVVIEVTLKDGNDNPISGNVTVAIEGMDNVTVVVTDGSGSKNIGKLDNRTYNFTARFDSGNYIANICTGEFEVTKFGTFLEVEVNETKYGQDAVVVIKLIDSNGTGITSKINLTVDGDVYELDVVNGTAIKNLGKLNAGTYSYNASFAGLPDQGPSEVTGTFTVSEVTTTLTVEAEDIKYGQDAIINITLIDELNNPVNGTVSITVNGKEHKVNVTNGSAKLNLGKLNATDYSYNAKFNATVNYGESTAAGQFKVEKLNTTLTVTIKDVTAAHNVTIKVNLVDEFGNPVDAYVNVTVGNETYRINAFNGTAVKVIGKLPEGNYTFNATYTGQVNYNRSTDEGSFKVIAYSTVLTIEADNITYGENATIVITLTDNIGNPVDGDVNVTFNNRNFTVTTVNGTVELVAPNLNAGDYVVNATFAGSLAEHSTNGTAAFTVFKGEVTININVTSSVVGNDVIINISMVDGFGKDVVGNVNVTVANTTVAVGVNKIAKVTVPNMAAGNYTVTVDYLGSSNYNASVAEAGFEVARLNSTMNITIPQVINANSNTTIVLKLDDDASGEVVLSIGTQMFTAPVVDGVANVVVANLTSSGVQDVVATYSGDDKYEGCSVTASVTVTSKAVAVLSAPEVELYFRNGTQFVVSLKDSEGNPLVGQEVVICINKRNYTRSITEEGIATMALNLPVGVYNVTVTYAGNENYTSANVSSKVTILSTLYADDLVKYFKNGSQFNVLVLDGNGNPAEDKSISLNINGVMYHRTTDKNGIAVMSINLPTGNYIVSVINDDNLEMISRNVEVLPILVDNSDLTKFFRNGSQYTVKALDDEGNAAVGALVQFNINGIIYDRYTDSNGTATMNINLGPGNYVITAIYKGSFVSNNVTVLSTIVSENIEMSASDRVPFVVTVLDGQGNPIGNQTLSFNINGKIYNRVSDVNGSAKLNINLPPSKYTITTFYNGLLQSNTILIKP